MAVRFASPKSKPQKAALRQKLDYPVSAFAGVDNRDDPVNIGDAFSPDTLNTVLDSVGAVLTAPGYIKLLTTKLPSPPTGGTHYYSSAGIKQFIYAAGNNWYKYNNVGGSTQLNVGAFSPTTPQDFDQYNDIIYGVDGTDFIQYNGSTCGLVGGISGVFTAPTNLRIHKNRAWIAQGSIIYFSDAGNPESFPAINYIAVNTNDGQDIKGLSILNDALVVFKDDSVWYVKGEPLGAGTTTTIGNLSLSQVNTSAGCVSFRTICQVGSVILFMARDGVYQLQSNSAKLISDYVNGTFRNDMNQLAQDKAWACYNPNQKKYILGYASAGVATPDKALVYDTLLDKWLIWDDLPGGWACNFRFNQSDSTLMGDPTQGNIYELFQGYAHVLGDNGTSTATGATTLTDTLKAWSANQFVDAKVFVGLGTGTVYQGVVTANTGTQLTVASWTPGIPPAGAAYSIGAYNSYWKTKIFDFDDPAMRKRYKYYNLFCDSEGNYNLQNGASIDRASLSFNLTPLSLSGGGSSWDEAAVNWDESGITWDTEAAIYGQQGLPGQGHFVQGMFGNFNANQPYRVYTMSWTYKLKRRGVH